MSTRAELLLPPRQLASCIAACVLRDTRGVALSEMDRLNFFPAAPLYTATLTLHGQIHIGDDIAPPDVLARRPAAGRWLFQPPRRAPHTSWNPGPLLAVTLAFFPDAWLRLGGTLEGAPPPRMAPAFARLEAEPLEDAWPAFWDAATVEWQRSGGQGQWAGSSRVKDWAYHVLSRLGQSSSLRASQRQLAQWTGLSRTSLDFFARIEDLHRLHTADPGASPAELACEAGYADQSHMGRMLKRATGFSPVALTRRIEQDEAFWCYRLLRARF